MKRFRGLLAPKWPENILGSIDKSKAKKGELLYGELCAGCHLPAVTSDAFWSDKYWKEIPGGKGKYLKVKLFDVGYMGTDPAQADVLPNRMVEVPSILGVTEPNVQGNGLICGGKEGTSTNKNLFAWALADVTQKTIYNWYDKHNISPEMREEMNGNRPNCVHAPKKYKARPLNGIWATAPFLHNGSVLTLDDLLKPASERPDTICLGANAYDPVKVGFEGDTDFLGSCPSGTFKLDATVAGNLNEGHSFEEGEKGKGIIGRKLSDAERSAIIEYLKTL